MITFPSLLINLIKSFDGLSLKAYRCSAGVRTIGQLWTHTGKDII
ncbi:MAG: lysozyme [Candidatus Liberibacter europaeus]|uniref:Lysozyme n=1 Tax=Candidatus Liberibacter europaeus TaxID=744859 RepID=A0A2T4VX55_9HYPH|nr:lysozyme [Candidatus Liberibacter europaeus]PTL86352.1 MAG: lysozyme [Candidatus Liberibacter europaeus]